MQKSQIQWLELYCIIQLIVDQQIVFNCFYKKEQILNLNFKRRYTFDKSALLKHHEYYQYLICEGANRQHQNYIVKR
ncbi:unnamed protein product [Paramecium sonneborni]|uniref:Uncharacterized protein n=1 Tax=Paramecium sonneborni TaxID=65129 RepID=A0A8S1NKU2_9CILI|nr:unnamed protein product [Paramecium sonneborni]